MKLLLFINKYSCIYLTYLCVLARSPTNIFVYVCLCVYDRRTPPEYLALVLNEKQHSI